MWLEMDQKDLEYELVHDPDLAKFQNVHQRKL